MNIITEMLKEPTAHHICDSGGAYGRAYQRNAERDFQAEPQAILKVDEHWIEISVSVWHHINALTERDEICEQFDAMDDGSNWNSDYYGVTQQQQEFLENLGAEVDKGWNSYNWDNNFDQTLQGHDVEINGERYTLLQIHGGCDVRSGYTGARLFKLDEWNSDYWLDDEASFGVPRAAMEAAGYPKIPGEYDGVSLDIRGYSGNFEIYDHNDEMDEVDKSGFKIEDLPVGLKIEGSARAVEH